MYIIFLVEEKELYTIVFSEEDLWEELDELDKYGVGYWYRKVS